jgi:hypothetical protein
MTKQLELTLDFTLDFHITSHLSTQKLYVADRSSSGDDFDPFVNHHLLNKPMSDKKTRYIAEMRAKTIVNDKYGQIHYQIK